MCDFYCDLFRAGSKFYERAFLFQNKDIVNLGCRVNRKVSIAVCLRMVDYFDQFIPRGNIGGYEKLV